MSGPAEKWFWAPIQRILDCNEGKFESLGFQAKAVGTVVLFDRGDYYCTYGDDAVFLAKEIFRSHSVLKSCQNDYHATVSYVTINQNQYQRIIRDLLLLHQYRVELYKQKSEKGQWELAAKGSPGNLVDFEDILSDAEQFVNSGTVLSLKICPGTSAKVVAMAACDIQTFTLYVAELSDSPHLSNTECAVVNFGPRECIVPEEKGDGDEVLEGILTRADILVSKRRKAEFNSSDILQDLNRLLKFKKNEIPNAAQMSEVNMGGAMSCLSALIKYLGLLADSTNLGRFRIETFHLGKFVRLDGSAVRALELFATSYTGGRGGTLYSLLNKCRTVPGRRVLDQWIRQPLRDIRHLVAEERLDIVEALVKDSGVRGLMLNGILDRVPDVLGLAKRMIRKKAGLQDCYKIYQLVKSLPKIVETLRGLVVSCPGSEAAIRELFLESIQHSMEVFGKFVLLIEQMVDMEYHEKTFSFRVKPESDPKLMGMDAQIAENWEKVEREKEKACKRLGLDTLKVEENPQHGVFFRITRKDEKVLRNNKDFKVLDTQKGGVRFTNNRLEILSERHGELRDEYDSKQQEIVDQIILIAAGYSDGLKNLSQVLGVLDVLTAFSAVSASASPVYVRPELSTEGERAIILEECRHPCLEEQDGLAFIPNGVSLQEGKEEVLIVTGPNMGGKSTYLRQTALCVLMAQMGCFVPCKTARVSLVDAIFTRVGASDHQSKGLSTFMVEMLETASILEGATKNSLIIVDELGRGTSTYDGFGLAWAIAEYIATKLRSFCLFATHFHELTELWREREGVKNLRVTASVEGGGFTLLYKVESGVAEESYGIQVAQLVKFPSQVVQDAKTKLETLEKRINQDQADLLGKQMRTMKTLLRNDQIDPTELRRLLKEF